MVCSRRRILPRIGIEGSKREVPLIGISRPRNIGIKIPIDLP
jgi:hypothetical protein